MGLRTWPIALANRQIINVKAPKADAEKLGHEIDRFIHLRAWTHNLAGIKDKDEYATLSCLIGTRDDYAKPIPHPAEYELDMVVYLAEIPNPVTEVEAEKKKVNALFYKHVRVNDERKTEIEDAAIKENYQKLHREQEQKQQQNTFAWLDAHGVPHDKVAVPDGMIAVFLQHTYDDSDAMTDYYRPHASTGEKLLLAIVPKQAETERLARTAISKYPELVNHSWEWHTEKYSMGHGNYLISEFCGTEDVGFKGVVKTRLEVQFGGNRWDKEMYAYPGYPGNGSAVAAAPVSNGKATMKLNAAHEGVEIKFEGKPSDETLSLLHSSGFRWSRRQHLWYAKQSPYTIAIAEQVTAAA